MKMMRYLYHGNHYNNQHLHIQVYSSNNRAQPVTAHNNLMNGTASDSVQESQRKSKGIDSI